MKKRKLSKNQTVIIAVIIVLVVLGVVYFAVKSARYDIKFGPLEEDKVKEEVLKICPEGTKVRSETCVPELIGIYGEYTECIKDNKGKFSRKILRCSCEFGDLKKTCEDINKKSITPEGNVEKCDMKERIITIGIDSSIVELTLDKCITESEKYCEEVCKNHIDAVEIPKELKKNVRQITCCKEDNLELV